MRYNYLMALDRKLEAVLFYKAIPMKKSALAKMFNTDEAEIEAAANILRQRLSAGSLAVVETDTDIELAVQSEFDPLIEDVRREEIRRDIGKAGAETLAIVMYRSPVTRLEVDRIRGVNSSYILRNLEMRGLIERKSGTKQVEYMPTTQLLRHLGIGKKTELQDYATVMDALENYEKQQENE